MLELGTSDMTPLLLLNSNTYLQDLNLEYETYSAINQLIRKNYSTLHNPVAFFPEISSQYSFWFSLIKFSKRLRGRLL